MFNTALTKAGFTYLCEVKPMANCLNAARKNQTMKATLVLPVFDCQESIFAIVSMNAKSVALIRNRRNIFNHARSMDKYLSTMDFFDYSPEYICRSAAKQAVGNEIIQICDDTYETVFTFKCKNIPVDTLETVSYSVMRISSDSISWAFGLKNQEGDFTTAEMTTEYIEEMATTHGL